MEADGSTETQAPDQTTGTDVRGARPLMERLMVFALDEEVSRLREEPAWREGDRNSMTLAKEADFRVLLTLLREGATLDERRVEGRFSVQILAGRAELRLGDEAAELAAGELATVSPGFAWALEAREETALLTTLAWPPEEP